MTFLEYEKQHYRSTYSDTINAALNMIRNKTVTDKARELIGPSQEKLDLLENNQRYMMMALNGIYRVANYTSRLINNGLPLVKINGNNVIKADKSLKDVARKKTLEDYSKLRSLRLEAENFMEDYPEDADNELHLQTDVVKPGDIDDEKKKWNDIYPFN